MMFSPLQLNSPSPIKSFKHFNLAGLSDDVTECSTSNTTFLGEEKGSTWKKSITIRPRIVGNPHVFIVKRIEDDESTELCLKIIEALGTYKSNVFVEDASFEELEKMKTSGSEAKFERFKSDEATEVDLLITIGGDGTILWALQHFSQTHAPPILAYSKGTRNYLCNFSKDGYEASLKRVMEDISNGKPIYVEQRDRIQCEINEGGKMRVIHALNEVTISRGGLASLARVECHLEDKYLASFEGDGVMIATPTGSTAYQLSAGGPIVSHLGSTMTITPIAPLNMTTRPLVLPSNLQLRFKMNKDSRKNIQLNVDGQTTVEINKNTEIYVTGSPMPLSFLMPEEGGDTLDNWIFRIRNLVGWNMSSNSFN